MENKKNLQNIFPKKLIRELINDERNSALFYSDLSLKANGEIRQILDEIGLECGFNAALLLGLGVGADRCCGRIIRDISLQDGLMLAADTERRSIACLAPYKAFPCTRIYQSKKERLKKLEHCIKILSEMN